MLKVSNDNIEKSFTLLKKYDEKLYTEVADEEVMDDLRNTLHDNHLTRLRDGECSVKAGIVFLDVLSHMESITDICSNIGVAIVARVNPETASLAHTYISSLHQGGDTNFNEEYLAAHSEFFTRLEEVKQV
ncbi:MAG: hypothetical protein K5654_07435 [Lachnospiraceae bacterium]|nr:hypothetical protein [Lachnospiraceae bacterium]